MTELPPHVGPEAQGMAQYSIECGYTGLTPDGPTCGKPSTTHVKWRNETGDEFGSTACDEHTEHARAFGIVAEHSISNSACCMPGSVWIDGPPSRCVIDDSGTGPEAVHMRELVMSR